MDNTPTAIVFVAVAGVMWGVYDAAYATNSTELDNIRTSVIAAGSIPDTYLIKPSGTYWDARNMTAVYERLEAWTLAKDESIPSERFQNEVNRELFNTAILLEGRIDIHHVTALAIARELALGTYDNNTAQYLKKYHDYIIDTFDIPNTASGINATLHQKLGDMAPLTDEIVSITHRAASIAGIPNKLLESDIEYWVDIELATYCRLNGGSGGANCVYVQPVTDAVIDGQDAASAGSSLSSTWYWRALVCLSSFRGYSQGAICSDTIGFSTGTKEIDETVSGRGIYSKLSVSGEPRGTTGKLHIEVGAGEKESKTIAGPVAWNSPIKGTWSAWSNLNDHPCYRTPSDASELPYCLVSTTWSFKGTATVTPPTPPSLVNSAPTANAGKDQIVQAGDTVTLSGTGSDSDGDTLSYEWKQTSNNTVQLNGSGKSRTFTAPEGPSTLLFMLTVSDNRGKSATDTVQIRVNGPPMANIGPVPQPVNPDTKVELDGSVSTDPDNDLLTYSWEQHPTSTVTLLDSDTATPSFMVEDDHGLDVVRFILTVTDIHNATDTAMIDIEVNAAPHLDVEQPEMIWIYSLRNPAEKLNNEILEFFGLHQFVTHTDSTPIHTYTGILAGEARFGLNGTDTNDDTLDILVAEKPKRIYLVDCDSIDVQYKNNNTITSGPSPLVGSVCLMALDTGSGIFELMAKDEHDASTNTEVGYNVFNGASVEFPEIKFESDEQQNTKKPKSTFKASIKKPGLGGEVPDIILYVASVEVLKCVNGDDTRNYVFCNIINLIRGTDYASALHGDSDKPQQHKNNAAWDVVAVISETTTSTHPDVVVTINTAGTEAHSRLTTDANMGASTKDITVEDHGVEEGGMYSYALGVTLNDGSHKYIPLGSVTVPDITAPTITLLGNVDITMPFNSAYVEPGYNATDNVDGDITSKVIVTSTLNTTKAGTYHIHYDVADDAGNQAVRQNRTVTVAPNMHPLADAGVNQTVRFGDVVRLNGSASTDPDNGTISHTWRQTAGPAVVLSDNMSPSPTFTAPDSVGTFTFELTVSDGYDTGTDTVTVTVAGFPTADAGIDQTVHRLQTVSLDGSASHDPDNDTLSYLWRQTVGPAVTLSNGTAPSPTFTSPDSAAAITFELTVSDGTYSDTDTVTIHVVNRPPVANAGPDRTVQSGENMTLSGAASTDADGDTLSYSWSVVTGPRISLTNPDSAQVSFVAPTGPVLLGILLTVHDGWDSSQDLVVIDVLRPPNRPPVSDAGIDRTAGYGKTIHIDGSTSHDPDSDTISYVWNQTAGIAVSLSDHTIPNPAFTTPNATTSITFELTVSDGHLAHTDAVTITVANRSPAADAGADRAAGFGHIITLDGSASDPDGDAISYVWNQTSGPAVILSDNAALSPSFAAPTSMATMTFEITASDGWLSHTDAVAITVVNHPPTSDAGVAQTVRLGDTVTLDGSASDPDGDTISYMWNQTAGPTVALSDDAASSPTFTAPSSAGILTFELTVSDGYDTDTDTVTITVVNRPPVASAGADQTVRFGDTVTLDGSASTDPDGDAITYVWKETSGTGVKLSDTTVQSPTFTAPGSAATLTFELTVSDGEFSSTGTVTITVKHPNRAPTANAGPDHTAGVGDTITLSGAASTDPDNDTLTYTWEVLIGPSQILSGTTGPSVTVTVPSGVGLLGIYLTVSDGQYASQDLVVITVE